MIYLFKGYLAHLISRIFHTVKQAGPEILMMAMAALPGALDKAYIVGSSLVKLAKGLLQLLSNNRPPVEKLILVSGHDCSTAVEVNRGKRGK